MTTKDAFPEELIEGLNYILADIVRDDRPDSDVDDDRLPTATSIQSVLKHYGYEITLAQAEAIYSNYSFNNWAGWLVGEPKDLDGAKLVLLDFAKDVLFGENHIGYGQVPD